MRKVEREERLFGTPAITEAWARAVMRHPVAYLRHRAAFMWNFLVGNNLTMWVADVEHRTETVFPDRPAFVALVSAARQAQADAAVPGRLVAAGLHRRVRVRLAATRDARRAPSPSAVCGSATVYVLTFFAVGVASDFRFGYWAVLAGIAGGVVATLRRPEPQVS